MHGAEMYQCFMCEDWFHAEHIDAADLLNSDDYTELCCPECSTKYPFISVYQYVCEQETKQQTDDLDKTTAQSEVIVF